MMANLAESYRDRELGLIHAATAPEEPVKRPAGKAFRPRDGERVRHERFGDGVVTAMVPDTDNDTRITILFDAAQERTFLLSLVQDKLSRAR